MVGNCCGLLLLVKNIKMATNNFRDVDARTIND